MAVFVLPRVARGRQQRVEYAILGGHLGAVAYFDHGLLPHHFQRVLGQIADHRFDVAADITDFGELGRLDLQKWRIG